MVNRNWMCRGSLSLAAYLLVCSWASAQDAGPKMKPDVQPKREASVEVGDDFRPGSPGDKPADRGPGGPKEFGRPGGFPGQGPDQSPHFHPRGKSGDRPGGQPGEGGPGAGGPGAGPFERGGFRPGEGAGGMPGPGMSPGAGPGMTPGMTPGMMPGFGPMSGPPRWPHGDWQSMEQNDPEMHKLLQADFNLAIQSQELAVQYRQAPQDQREAIKQKLEKTITEHFEARQQRRLLELQRLEEELKRLRESIDKRKEAQAQIIQRRVSELLGLEDDTQF